MKRKSYYSVLLCLMCFIMSFSLSFTVMAGNKARKPNSPILNSVKLSSPKKITVSWSKAKNANQYELYVSRNGKVFKKLATVKSRSYTHRGLKPGSTYRYKVRAINGNKKSGYSNIKSFSIVNTNGDYYDGLKETILNSGETSSDGIPWLDYSDDDYDDDESDNYNLFYIDYIQTTDTLKFHEGLFRDNYLCIVSLYVDNTAIKTGNAKIEYGFIPYGLTQTGIYLNTFVDMATYHKNQQLNWNETDLDNSASIAVSLFFESWDAILKKQTNITLNDLGFKAFIA